MKEKSQIEKNAEERQIELLSTALNEASNAGGHWLNATGKGFPKFYPKGVAVSPFNGLFMALHSDRNGCKTNLFTLYSDAKARGTSVREHEQGVPFLFYNWNKYVHRNNPEDIISRDAYLKLDEEVQKQYKAALAKYNTNLNDAEVAAEVAGIIAEKVPANNTPEVKKFLFNCIDLTTLNSTDSDESVMKFTQKVNQFDEEFPDLKNVAAICVYPNFAEVVKDTLEVEDVKIACVSAGFPSSQTFIEVKVAETAMAIMEGADEIDIVISVGKFLSGDYETMCDEIQELKATCKEHHLKVILETGALKTAANIKKASILSMYAGADFIKTSTGKQQPAATPEAAYVMCQAIKEYHALTGNKIGFKPAGGINCVNDALIYYTIVKEVLGEEWLNNGLFRLGTSRLANLLLSEIKGEEMKFF